MEECAGNDPQTFLDSGAARNNGVFEFPVQPVGNYGAEQRLLARVAGINGRLTGMGDVGDFVHAGGFEATFKEDLPGGIQNPLLNLPCELTRRPAGANFPAPR